MRSRLAEILTDRQMDEFRKMQKERKEMALEKRVP